MSLCILIVSSKLRSRVAHCRSVFIDETLSLRSKHFNKNAHTCIEKCLDSNDILLKYLDMLVLTTFSKYKQTRIPLSGICMFVCLFDLNLYVPSTIFQFNRDGSVWVEQVPR